MWIELHDSTSDHPKVIKLARDLKIARVQALGHVVSLWVWTLRMAPDGDLSSFDMDDIEIGAQWEGDVGAFVESATKRGLIDVTPDGLIVHDWTEYATHLKAAERKRKQRIRTKESRVRNTMSRDTLLQGDDVTPCHADRPTDRQNRPDRTDQTDRLARVPRERYTSDILAVFDHYRTYHPKALKKPAAKSKEWKSIKARIDEGSTVDDLKLAIDGCHRTPHNMGQNERNEKYLGLELIMRNGGQVSRFIENADRFAPGSEATIKAGLAPKTRKTTEALQRWMQRDRTNETD